MIKLLLATSLIVAYIELRLRKSEKIYLQHKIQICDKVSCIRNEINILNDKTTKLYDLIKNGHKGIVKKINTSEASCKDSIESISTLLLGKMELIEDAKGGDNE